MNRKAAITKDINARHLKILEGLLKLPENRECADCKRRAPRWASVNIGIFICMQCSGIHRSLGVHISKVRSATLDTWLPEQIAFIQSVGNEKSNAYWEAELPPNYDRVKIENFIQAKYVDKRWVLRDGNYIKDLRAEEALSTELRPRNNGERVDANNHVHLYRERKSGNQSSHLTKSGPVPRHPENAAGNSQTSTRSSCSTANSFTSEPPSMEEQGKVGPNSLPAAEVKAGSSSSSCCRLEKNEYAAELFMMMLKGDSLQTIVTDKWVGFEAEEEYSVPSRLEERGELKNKSDIKMSLAAEVKNLNDESPAAEVKNLKDESRSLVPFNSDKIQDSAKTETEKPSPSPKSNSLSMESIHHQRLAMLADNELMRVEARPCAVVSNPTQMIDQPSSSIHLIQHQQSNGDLIHGQQQFGSSPIMSGRHRTQSNGQVMQQRQSYYPQNLRKEVALPLTQMHTMNHNARSPANPAMNYSAGPSSGMSSSSSIINTAGRAMNGGAVVGTRVRSSPTPSTISSLVPVSGYDYDFSSLTQGFYKRQ